MFLTEPPAEDHAQARHDADRHNNGYVDNLTRLWCWRPDVLEAYEHARDLVLHECGLSDRDVALLVAATAAARSDSYCALAGGSRLAACADVQTAATVLAGSADGLDDRGTALVRWARQVARDPNSTTSADVDRLREVGLSDRQVFAATVFITLGMAFSTGERRAGRRARRAASAEGSAAGANGRQLRPSTRAGSFALATST